jgi:hypothetical protein
VTTISTIGTVTISLRTMKRNISCEAPPVRRRGYSPSKCGFDMSGMPVSHFALSYSM